MFEDGHWDFCYQINSMETKTQVFINNNNNNVLCHLTQLPWGIWFWKVSSFMENWTHGIRAITTEKQSRAHTASQKLFPNWQKTTRGRRRDYLRPSHASGLDQWRSSAGTPKLREPRNMDGLKVRWPALLPFSCRTSNSPEWQPRAPCSLWLWTRLSVQSESICLQMSYLPLL